MNIEFTHINNKAFISDENGNKKVVPYYDNLYNVLSKENMIELIEKEIEETYKNKKELGYAPKHYIPVCVPTCLAAGCILPLLFKLTGVTPDAAAIQTSFGTFADTDLICLSVAVATLPLFSIYDILFYKKYKNVKKASNANEIEIEYLKRELISLKEEIEVLKNDTTNSIIQKEDEWRNINVVGNPFVKEYINNLVNLYYNLGYDEKKLYRYYLNGKLNKIFEGNNLELAKNYFKEKGPVLSKKYKNKEYIINN